MVRPSPSPAPTWWTKALPISIPSLPPIPAPTISAERIPTRTGTAPIPASAWAITTRPRLFGSNNTIHWNVNANGVAGNTSCPAQNLFAYNGLNRHSNGVADDLWVRFYSRWHAANNDWTFAYMKMYYTQSPGLNNEPGVYYESYNPGSTTGPMQMLVKVGGLDVTPSVPNPPDTTGRINNDEWHLYELEQNSLVSPPVVSVWMDGVQLQANYSGDAGAGVTLSNWYLLIGMVNTCGYDANLNVDEWFAGFAFGSARLYPASFVEISNTATYGSGTKIYQLPTNISDTSQAVTVNPTGLGGGPYYLFVTNNLQQTSSAFSLSGSASVSATGTLHLSVGK